MKLIKGIVGGVMTGVILTAGILCVSALTEPSSPDLEINQKLEPYLQAMAEVNEELGDSFFFLQEENLQEAYEQICQMSLEEFQNLLRESYWENAQSVNSKQATLKLIPYNGHVDDAIQLGPDHTETIRHPNGTVEDMTRLTP